MIDSILTHLNITEQELNLYKQHVLIQNIPLSKTGCSAQEFRMWKKYGLVDSSKLNNESSKRVNVKLNLVDAVWVRLLLQLRLFGIDAVRYKKIHEYLMEDLSASIVQEVESGVREFLALDREIDPEIISEIVKDLDKKGSELICGLLEKEYMPNMTYFAIIVIFSLLKNQDVHLYVYIDDSSELNCIDFIDGFEISEDSKAKIDNIKANPHVYISLQHLIRELIGNEKIEYQLYDSKFFSKHLMILFEMIRKEEVREIIIVKKGGNSIEITVTEEEHIKDESVKKVKQAIGFNDCKEINIKTRNHKHLIVRKTTSNTYEFTTQ